VDLPKNWKYRRMFLSNTRKKRAPATRAPETPAGNQSSASSPRKQDATPRTSRSKGRVRPGTMAMIALIVSGAIAVLAVIYFANGGTSASSASSGAYPFQVGAPAAGKHAPAIDLASTSGGTFQLGAQRGKSTLLFFQEGTGCEPCWTQIKDIEPQWSKFRALGIDQLVTITTNSLDQLKQKVADEQIRTPVLSDPDVSVSRAYNANQYGMMGDQMDGHSFVLVGRDGVIKWRADYGGSPKYIMYLPVSRLIADIRKGLHGQSA
jgi:peroxiredoxin